MASVIYFACHCEADPSSPISTVRTVQSDIQGNVGNLSGILRNSQAFDRCEGTVVRIIRNMLWS